MSGETICACSQGTSAVTRAYRSAVANLRPNQDCRLCKGTGSTLYVAGQEPKVQPCRGCYPALDPTCLTPDDRDDPLSIHSPECQLMEAWRIGSAANGEWLDDGTGTPEEAAHRAGWEVLHEMEDYDGAILARPRTSTALYVVSDFGGPRAVLVAS